MEHRLRRPHAFMDLSAKLLECYPLSESVLVDISQAISILDDDIHISELAEDFVAPPIPPRSLRSQVRKFLG